MRDDLAAAGNPLRQRETSNIQFYFHRELLQVVGVLGREYPEPTARRFEAKDSPKRSLLARIIRGVRKVLIYL